MFKKFFLIFGILSAIGAAIGLICLMVGLAKEDFQMMIKSVIALVGCFISFLFFMQLHEMQKRIEALEDKLNHKKE